MNRKVFLFHLPEPTIAWAVFWKEQEPVGIVFAQFDGLRAIGDDAFMRDIDLLGDEITKVYNKFLLGKGNSYEREFFGGSEQVEEEESITVPFTRELVGNYEVEYMGWTPLGILKGLIPARADLFWDDKGRRLYMLIYHDRTVQIQSKGLTEAEVASYVAEVFIEGQNIANLMGNLS